MSIMYLVKACSNIIKKFLCVFMSDLGFIISDYCTFQELEIMGLMHQVNWISNGTLLSMSKGRN